VDGQLNDWGTWSQNAQGKWRFDVTDTAEREAADVEFATEWDLTDNVITDGTPYPYSGGEWFDIEGLYMDFVRVSATESYLHWALITSYAGLEPYWYDGTNAEWNPRWNGYTAGIPDPSKDTGYYNPQHGTLASRRDGYNTAHWNYRSNPVIGISLDADDTYEWGLILDPSDTQSRGNINSAAALYYIGDASAWSTWYGGVEYPTQETSVDFDTSKAELMVTGEAGSSIRRFAYLESRPTQILPNYIWHQDYNWVWEGCLDMSSLPQFFSSGDESVIHYSMWCGNDGALARSEAGINRPPVTPELPPAALLFLGMVPAAFALRRRGKS